MKRIFLTIIVILFGYSGCFSQTTKNVLFLIPLRSNDIAQADISQLKDQHDIERLFSRSLIGFWEGAQIALEEISAEGYSVNVIVRDITDDLSLLQNTLNSNYLPQNIDLIIAPVYGKMFPYIAEFAKEHKIPTVNPFAKKEDIVKDNPYIYKLYPTATNRAQYLAEHYPHSNIILWQSPNPSKNQNENNEYESYFTEHQIPYTIIMDSVSIAPSLSSTRENIVISCKTGKNSYQKSIHKILNNRIKQNFIWIIPEEWMHSADINFENFSGLDIRFFTNYFVDSKDEKVQVFNYNFIERYHNIPTIETFAYQGYDVTNFFVRLICNDFNIPQNISPLSYEFQMRNVPGGGYENVKTRFIRMQDLNLQEIKE